MTRYTDTAVAELTGADRAGLIVGLHGLTGDHRQPRSLLEGFDDPRWGVLLPDLRGHGDSGYLGEAEDFTPRALADDVADLVAAYGLQPERVALFGISFGATVALELARSRRLPVSAAAFVRPTHTGVNPHHLRANLTIARLLASDPVTAPALLHETTEYREVAAVSAASAANLRAKVADPRAAERVMRLELGSVWSAWDESPETLTGVHMIVIGAERDPLHPESVAREWASRLPGADLVWVPPQDDDEERYRAATKTALQDFLIEHDARQREEQTG